jgi:AcrR family transcriptional regulator
MNDYSSPWINPPKQERSRKTLQRLLDVAETMLDEGSFEAAPVRRIVRHANSSVGSFYSLFKNKNALFECLLDRYQDRLVDVAQSFARDPRWQQASLCERSLAWVTRLVSFFRQERGLMRARILHNILRPETVPEYRKEKARLILDEIRAFFRPSLDEIAAAEPQDALDFALMTLDYVAAYKILLEDEPQEYFGKVDDRRLQRELNRVFLAYLGLSEVPEQTGGRPEP